MFDSLKVVSWASVREHCPMRHSVTSSNEMVFVFGSGRDEFEFAFEVGALRKLVKLGVEVLTEMDARAELEEAEERSA
jgi:hypothetical protein